MTAFDYAKPTATADRLLTRFGQAGTLRRPTTTGAAYDPTAGSPEDHDATFAVTRYSDKEIDGSRILDTDKKVLLAKGALTIEPKVTDKLVIGGTEHAIIKVQPLSPGGTVVLWTLQCR